MRRLILLILLPLLVNCSLDYRPSFGRWVNPIPYSVNDDCPDFIEEEAGKILETVAPVGAYPTSDSLFEVSCTDNPVEELGMEVGRDTAGRAAPIIIRDKDTGEGIIIVCTLWVNPDGYKHMMKHEVEQSKSVLLHEILHCLGMGHANGWGSTAMAPRMGSRAREMSELDWTELRRIYGLQYPQ